MEPAGKSAYEVALQNGFTGTEADWLTSLKGQKGDAGEPGATGAKGDPGEKGDRAKREHPEKRENVAKKEKKATPEHLARTALNGKERDKRG